MPEKAMLLSHMKKRKLIGMQEPVIYVGINLKETLKNEVNGKLKIIVIMQVIMQVITVMQGRNFGKIGIFGGNLIWR